MSDPARKRRTLAAIAGAAVAAGALVAYARARTRPAVATLPGDAPYLRFGAGPAPLIVMWGGPGNNLPAGLAPFLKRAWRALLRDHTVYIVSRRSGLPAGYSTRQMAGDLAATIRQAFHPPVDVMGVSLGGMIVQHLAADHGSLVRHLVIATSAYRLGEEGRAIDSRYARHASRGNWGAAYAVIAESAIERVALRILGSLGKPAVSRTFAQDVQVELEADLQHDSRDRLAAIRVPTLVICGANDPYYPADLVRQTAASIPNAKLILYPNKGHNLVVDRRFAADVHAFLSEDTT